MLEDRIHIRRQLRGFNSYDMACYVKVVLLADCHIKEGE